MTGAFARKLPIRLRTTVVGAEPRPELDAPLHDRINRRRARSRIAATISTAFVVAIGVAAIAGARGMTPASHRPAGDGSPAPTRSGHWSTLPRAPIPAPAQDLSVWTGTKMLVWGGFNPAVKHGPAVGDGAAYDPKRRSWRKLPASPHGYTLLDASGSSVSGASATGSSGLRFRAT